jgi:predicted nucleotidyltransferase
MNAQEIADALRQSRTRLSEYHIKALYLFGSVVRGEASPESDVDVLVEFEPDAHVGLFAFARLQRQLSEMLGRPVDLATPDSLHKALKEQVLKEAVRAA